MTGPKLPPLYTLVALDTVDSTNAEAARRAEDGAPDGLVVWARSQSAARGRRGRGWVSPEGELYVSILVRPDKSPEETAQIGFVAGIAALQACAELCPPMTNLRLKWPNDLLVNGRKAAGLLLEAGPAIGGLTSWAVIGLGLNLRTAPADLDDNPATAPTSIAAEAGVAPAPEQALERFARAFLSWRDEWIHGGFGRIRKAWLGRAWGLGERLTARLDAEELSGLFEDLDADGRLILRRDDGTARMIAAADILSPAPAG